MIEDEKIYRYFLGDIRIPEMYISPIPPPHRKRDTNESFGLYIPEKDGVIRWKDWGLADPYGNKAVNLIQYLRGLSLDTQGYFRAKTIAETEVAREYLTRPFVELQKSSRIPSDVSPYVEWNTDFKDFELRYWNRYDVPNGISAEDLHQEQIYGLKSYQWIGSSSGKVISTPADPAFVYVFRRNPISYKVYRPLNQSNHKFRQHNIDGVVEGAHILEREGNYSLGILVSSTKERLIMKKIFPEILFLNPTAEASYTNLIQLWSLIRPRAKRWLVMYDSDDAGFNAGTTIANHLIVKNIDMRGRLDGQKDFSDFVDRFRGKKAHQELKTLILNLIQ